MTVEWRVRSQELQSVAEWAQKTARAWRKVVRTCVNIIRGFVISSYTGNPRVRHLALHARKARTRKKNYHKILRENRRDR